MIKRTMIGLTTLVLAALVCAQTVPVTGPDTRPAATSAATSSPASATSIPADADPAVVKILMDLQDAGKKYSTICANIDYDVKISRTSEIEKRTGNVSYSAQDAKTSAKFMLTFDTYKANDDAVEKRTETYAFDGEWFSILKPMNKQMQRYQRAGKGQIVPAMEIGKGPFPLPFGQQAATVLASFDVTTRALKEAELKDPKLKDTVYLLLVPKAAAAKNINFTKLEMWVDPKLQLPIRLISVEPNKNVSTVVFKDVVFDKKLDPAIFSPSKPSGWNIIEEPLKE